MMHALRVAVDALGLLSAAAIAWFVWSAVREDDTMHHPPSRNVPRW